MTILVLGTNVVMLAGFFENDGCRARFNGVTDLVVVTTYIKGSFWYSFDIVYISLEVEH